MRRAVTACALLTAAVTMAEAAVPPVQPQDDRRSLYRVRGIGLCIPANRAFSDGGAVVIECRCAVDLLIERSDSPPPLDENNVGRVLEPFLAECRSATAQGGKVPTMSAATIEPADQAEPGGKPVAGTDVAEPGGKPVAEADAASAPVAEAKRPAPGWLAWTGLPSWALWLIPGFALLAGLVVLTTRRRRGGRGDLIAPPPSMRGDAVVGPRERE